MEYPTRQNASVRLSSSLCVLAALVLLIGFAACNPDTSSQQIVPEEEVSQAVKPAPGAKSEGTVIDENGVPSMINGKRVKSVTQVDGGIEPYKGDDPRGDGREIAIKETTATFTGFAGISPCDVIKTQDLDGWPGGIGNASSERSNMGEVVLGCITTFQNNGRKEGTISVYFSDNQTPALALESVQMMPQSSGGSATLITDWDKPAAYDAKTGEFVWSHNNVFIVLVIAHPGVMKDNLSWSKKLASAIEARMP